MTYKPTDIADEGTIVLRSSNIRNGKIDLTDLVRVKTIIRENQFVEQNDIVICARNGSKALVGKCAIFNLAMSESVSFGAFMAILRTAFYDYVYYFLNTQLFRNILNSDDSKQINQLTQDVLKNTLIPFPPQNEQRKIVTALNEIMHQISSIDNNANAVEHTKEVLKSRILELAIQGKLVPQDENDEPAGVLLERIRAERKAKLGKKYVESYIFKGDDNCYYEKICKNEPVLLENLPFDIPDSWCWARLGDIGDWGAGATPPRGNLEYYGGNIPWVKTGELNDDYIFLSVETVSSKALQECSLRYNKIGDILIAMYGATIGKLGIAGVKLTTNQACCACTPYEGVYNIYLFYYLKEEKDRFTKLGTGGAQPNISREKIINYLIPIPPYNEQLRICEQVKNIFNTMKGEN